LKKYMKRQLVNIDTNLYKKYNNVNMLSRVDERTAHWLHSNLSKDKVLKPTK
jgi:hypothetical protein